MILDPARPDLAVSERPADRVDAPLVVLVHGTLDRGRSMRRVVERLADLHVVVYDRRGYGDSIGAGPPTGLRQHADDLLAVIGDRRATVVAHSFGGHVAVLAAIAEPERVESVGLWELPVPWMDFVSPDTRRRIAMLAGSADPEAVGEQTRRRMMGEEAWARLPEQTRAECRAEGRAFVVDMASEVEAPYVWSDLRVPCVIGYGERRAPDTYEGSRQLADAIGFPTFPVPDAPHAVHLQRPDVFADFVRRAVAGRASTPTP